MPIRFTRHALDQAARRGTTLDEMRDVVVTAPVLPARPGYDERSNVYAFDSEWRGKHYPEKKVRVITVTENGDIVVVTVYVYFGSWTQ